MKTKVEIVYTPQVSGACPMPLVNARVSAGYPSPAADYEEDNLDLNRHLIHNPAATFFVRVTGDSMIGAGIHHGDLLVVDRSLQPRDKNVVIADLDGELTVKRIRIRRGKLTLEPENRDYPAQEIRGDRPFEVWGVATHVIHPL
jgi:DNA polymerase V